ncbi:hypothetical protein BOX15_Mlig015650g2 [Macrostomum lignano]|uniref:Uncharacterized protein n=1 Tax=Macrostomum lignano TaxID=282301 RepID=A0A267ELP5_9PLAT|nr:hypothetical protein BOX15_Mlig015650g2 [Macrostomum lignano]
MFVKVMELLSMVARLAQRHLIWSNQHQFGPFSSFAAQSQNCGPYARLLNECHWLVIEALDGGEHPKDIARLLNVKEKVAYSIQQRLETLPAEIACERGIAKESCSRASGPTATRCSGDEPFVEVSENAEEVEGTAQVGYQISTISRALEKQLKIAGRDADIPAVRNNLQTVERRQECPMAHECLDQIDAFWTGLNAAAPALLP